ncbi:MAG: sarcinarray family MAST domain-containing protein, partial [Methanosarcinales archaeon]|nr:sarcinarray family MAST domain-containing protein [Methanosarcinales archaeon]
METKTVRLTSDMLKGVAYRAKMEDIDEYTAIRQLMKFGVMWYAVNLYKIGKITLSEAAEPYPGESFYTLKLRNTNLLGPTGMYLLPSMNPWICTVNSWYIEVEGLKLKINEPVEIKVEVTSKIDGGFIGIILCEPGVTKSFDVISGPSDFGKYIIKDDIKSGWVKTYTWTICPNGNWVDGNAPINIFVQFSKEAFMTIGDTHEYENMSY